MASLSRPNGSFRIRFRITTCKRRKSNDKFTATGITARSGVSAPLARYCLKIARPVMMLPTVQIIETYVTICDGVGELIPSFLPPSPHARNPTFVLRSTVAFGYMSRAAERKRKRTTYKQVGVTNTLINLMDKACPTLEAKALVKCVQLLRAYIWSLQEEWCENGQEYRALIRTNTFRVLDVEIVISLSIRTLQHPIVFMRRRFRTRVLEFRETLTVQSHEPRWNANRMR